MNAREPPQNPMFSIEPRERREAVALDFTPNLRRCRDLLELQLHLKPDLPRSFI
jgi:hypothetical protein